MCKSCSKGINLNCKLNNCLLSDYIPSNQHHKSDKPEFHQNSCCYYKIHKLQLSCRIQNQLNNSNKNHLFFHKFCMKHCKQYSCQFLQEKKFPPHTKNMSYRQSDYQLDSLYTDLFLKNTKDSYHRKVDKPDYHSNKNH